METGNLGKKVGGEALKCSRVLGGERLSGINWSNLRCLTEGRGNIESPPPAGRKKGHPVREGGIPQSQL